MKAVDPFQGPTGIQPGRGGFPRDSRDVPYVTDPTGATVKSGARKGEPKRLRYSSTSGFGRQIENPTNLVKWAERKIIEGLATDPTLLDRYDPELGNADSVVAAAKQAADANRAADVGTHIHWLLELYDLGHTIVDALADGVELGLTNQQQVAVIDAWKVALAVTGIEVLEVERAVVDDAWRCAGTLDRIVRCTRDLHFVTDDGREATIPAGTVVVLDVKTGSLRLTHAIQTASYAQAVPYDTAAETRGVWPWPIDQTHALIAHVDVRAGTVGFIHVDLVAGREHGGACVVQAKAWEARADVFAKTSVAVSVPADPASSSAVEPPVVVQDAPAPVGGRTLQRTPADEQDAIRSRPTPDEGDSVDDPTFDVLQREYLALGGEGRAWITALTEQANRGGVPFHTKGHRTRRRYEIVRALVLVATDWVRDGFGPHVDQYLRDLLEPIIGDCAQFPTVPLGHLVGSLSATEAAQLGGLLDGRYLLVITDEGRPTLRPAA